jgi:conjugative transfer pilus assembly protein TraH
LTSLLLGFFCPKLEADDWVDEWFDSATYSGPSSYSTKNRKMISGGSFAVRSTVKTDYPITVSLPKISAGCGGISGFMGGFSFLDADYLIDKAQRMMQAAPYVAMDMALKAMSKEFSDTIKSAEALTNTLNSIQLNECSTMKPILTAAMNKDKEGFKQSLSEIANAKQIKDNAVRLWTDAKREITDNDNKSPVDLAEEIEGCPADIKHFFSPGSVIEKITGKTGMGDYSKMFKGFFGDMVIQHKDNNIVTEMIMACTENRHDGQAFLFGKVYARNDSGKCKEIKSKSVYEIVDKKLNSLADKITEKKELSAEDKAFASRGTPLPILAMLRIAHEQGTVSETKQGLLDITAIAYAYRVADSFYHEALAALQRVSDEVDTNHTQEDSDKSCNMRVLTIPAEQVRKLLRRVRDARDQLASSFDIELKEHTRFDELIDEMRRRESEIKRQERLRFISN